MRGGKSLADRGMIPRMLSNIYRKSKAIEKSSGGETTVEVAMSYYEIYTDRVFDLFEPPEKRTATGLPIREAEGGKTVIAGLSEMPCSSLKEFEILYDRANANRSVGATKLNAESSRSHAILCVRVTINTATESRSSTISAIDLAGSEDNRRTGNVKERMVESASINKSLFVLAQCVEAISKKQNRIPYRESKMTRILSLGQNNGLTVMILNLPPTKAFHLDTLSSLNFANRTKKIEVREIENEPVFKGPPRPQSTTSGNMARQPLRPLNSATNVNILANRDIGKDREKPLKAFSVYADKSKVKISPLKRQASEMLNSSRPVKQSKSIPATSLLRKGPPETQRITAADLEALVEKKVSEVLAARAPKIEPSAPVEPKITAEVQARLDRIEKRLEGQDGERAEGLSYLFMAKQHQARGEDGSALKMYELAQPFFPGNEKLDRKIEKLRAKTMGKRRSKQITIHEDGPVSSCEQVRSRKQASVDVDESYQADDNEASYFGQAEAEHSDATRLKKSRKQSKPKAHRTFVRADSPDPLIGRNDDVDRGEATPRTKYLIDVLNTKSISKLKALSGLGVKKAEAIVDYLDDAGKELESWQDVLDLDVRGIGKRSWEVMREGVLA